MPAGRAFSHFSGEPVGRRIASLSRASTDSADSTGGTREVWLIRADGAINAEKRDRRAAVAAVTAGAAGPGTTAASVKITAIAIGGDIAGPGRFRAGLSICTISSSTAVSTRAACEGDIMEFEKLGIRRAGSLGVDEHEGDGRGSGSAGSSVGTGSAALAARGDSEVTGDAKH